jgi:hypothetical protein
VKLKPNEHASGGNGQPPGFPPAEDMPDDAPAQLRPDSERQR